MYLGIGTVKNESSAQAYVDAGAELIICPGIFERISEIAERNKLLCVPGAMTVTDIMRAEATGATIVKLFPANGLGPEYLDTIKAIFPGLSFLPTGGIELSRENLTGWIKSGVCAVGGSKLLTKSVIENELYDELTKNARQALELFQNIKSDLYPTNKIEISISQ
jgi:2-dehydro-3-deoxyphosphogluconate aldolase/(4S)-4-hydroxy-2-oxoglutarate aldolase